MIFYPAIDIRGGRCVRLAQGDFARETLYGDDPVAMARRWQGEGAAWLHVVDLDGAREGVPRNRALIERLVGAVSIPVQLGGGIRELSAARAYRQAGVRRIVLGSVLVKDPVGARAILEELGAGAGLGIDARGGEVAIEGWRRLTGKTALEVIEEYREFGPSVVVYTDIGRDGMLCGPNLEETRRVGEFCKSAGIEVILSGGVSSLDDLRAVRSLADNGVSGVISGKALYSGSLQVAEAIAALR